MMLYMNRRDVPEAEQGVLSSAVIDYVVGRAHEYERRCRALYGRYIGVPQIHRGEDENDVRPRLTMPSTLWILSVAIS